MHLTAAAATNLCLIPALPENRQLNGTQPSVASASYPTGRRRPCGLEIIVTLGESANLRRWAVIVDVDGSHVWHRGVMNLGPNKAWVQHSCLG